MIDQTIAKIEERLGGLTQLDAAKREELARLLSRLKAEVGDLSESESEHVESIARFAELSSHEATRSSQDQRLRSLSLEGLAASVDGFEASHPRLVEVVNSICMSLANLGI